MKYRNFNLLLGLGLMGLVLFLPAPDGMGDTAWKVVAVTLLLATWWATEALPVPITSLLPLVMFPALGVFSFGEAAAPYAKSTVFLLLGGFIMATGLARWNLHRRLALHILTRVGDHPAALIGGFMGVTALISMWISNTASTIMMIPIALSVAGEVVKEQNDQTKGFILCLILGIAYSASIGGLGTPIGTPPNAFVVAFMKETYDVDISFLSWMMFGIPTVLIMTPLAWWVLTRWAYPFDLQGTPTVGTLLQEELVGMGRMSTPEKRMALVFGLVAACWVFRVPAQQHFAELSWLSDALIAIGGAMIMFMVPSGSKDEKNSALLDWDTANKIPWGVLLLFGGGLSLAAAVAKTGLAVWLGDALTGLATLDLVFIMLALVTMVIFLTELTSNTATTATLLPVLGALAVSTGMDPMLLFAPAALSASCAFMLPVATAPNAVIYSTGTVTIPQMAAAGLRLNLVAIVAVTTISYLLIPVVFG